MGQLKDNPCTGQCCEKFWLPYSPEELREYYVKIYKYKETDPLFYAELEQIAPMVIYIGPTENGNGHWYTCKWYDKETTMCTIYEVRPDMCRNYPYDQACEYCGWENEEFQQREVLPAGGISAP